MFQVFDNTVDHRYDTHWALEKHLAQTRRSEKQIDEDRDGNGEGENDYIGKWALLQR